MFVLKLYLCRISINKEFFFNKLLFLYNEIIFKFALKFVSNFNPVLHTFNIIFNTKSNFEDIQSTFNFSIYTIKSGQITKDNTHKNILHRSYIPRHKGTR